MISVDTKELELINTVARIISPGAWDDAPVGKMVNGGVVVDDEFTRVSRSINDSNRERARDKAMEIIEVIATACKPPESK